MEHQNYCSQKQIVRNVNGQTWFSQKYNTGINTEQIDDEFGSAEIVLIIMY
jgi:hypothetical protein